MMRMMFPTLAMTIIQTQRRDAAALMGEILIVGWLKFATDNHNVEAEDTGGTMNRESGFRYQISGPITLIASIPT